MKGLLFQRIVLTLLCLMMLPAGSRASFTIGGASPQSGTLDLNLTTQTAVQLVIQDGVNSLTLQPTAIVDGVGSGTVSFGTFNTIDCPTAVSTGECTRLASANGARVVASAELVPSVSGFSSSKIEVYRSDALATVPTGRVRWTASDNDMTTWGGAAPGTVMSEASGTPDTVAAVAPSGSTTNFQVAVELADTDAAGAKNVQITFSITGNP